MIDTRQSLKFINVPVLHVRIYVAAGSCDRDVERSYVPPSYRACFGLAQSGPGLCGLGALLSEVTCDATDPAGHVDLLDAALPFRSFLLPRAWTWGRFPQSR